MPETAIVTVNRGYTLVRKALNAAETWDWFSEYTGLWTDVDADIQVVDDKIDALIATIGDFTANNIDLQAKTDSTSKSVQDFINTFPGRGVVSYGAVTDNLDGTVTIGEGLCFASTVNSPSAQKAYFTVQETIVTLSTGSNYIVVDFTGAAPFEWEAVANPTNYQHREDRILIDIVYYEPDTTVRIIDATTGYANFYTQMIQRAQEFALGKGYLFAERATGAIIGDTGVRYVTLSSGVFWAAMQRKESPAFDTSGADTMIRYYQDGVGGWTKQSGQTQLDNQNYDDGSGTLAAMNVGRFKCVSMYLLFDAVGLVELEGQAQYTSLALAEEEGRPSNVPPILSGFSVYLGRYIVQQGNDTVVVESAFTTDISVGPVTSHTSLSNLQGDSRNQHYNAVPDIAFPTAWDVINNEWGSNSAYVRVRDMAELSETPAITGDAYDIAICDRHIFTVHATGGLLRFNKNDFSYEESNPNFTSQAPITPVNCDRLLQLNSTELRIINTNTLEYEAVSQTHGTVLAAFGHPVSSKTYCINSSDDMLTLAGTYPHAIVSTDAIAGLVASVVSLTVDQAEDYAYVLDGSLAPGNLYIRKIDLSTHTVVASSSAELTVNASFAHIAFHGDLLAVVHDDNATANVQICDLFDTALTKIFSGSVSGTFSHGTSASGLMYSLVPGSGTFTIKVHQFPALVTKLSSHVDMAEIESSAISQLRDSNYNRVLHTFADFQRAALLASNPALMSGTAALDNDGFTINSGEYSQDRFRVNFQPVTQLNADLGPDLGGLGIGHVGYDRYLYLNESSSTVLHKVDKITGATVLSRDTGITGFGGMARVVMLDSIVAFDGANIHLISPDDLVVSTQALISGTATATTGACVRPEGDIAFCCNATNTIARVTESGGNFTAAAVVLSEVTSPIGIACNTDYYFVLDNDGTVYSYDRATNTNQASYASGIGATVSLFGFYGDYLILSSPSLLTILNTDLEKIFDDPVSWTNVRVGFMYEGIMYGQEAVGPDYIIQSYLLPALVATLPARVDAREIESSLHELDGDVYSFQDWCRAARDAITLAERTYVVAAGSDYSGFTRNDELTVEYDSVARTVTVSVATGVFDLFYKGVKILDSLTTWTSSAHTASPTGSLFLSYNDSGYTWSYTPWAFEEAQIAYVYVSGGAGLFCIREMHGLMQAVTHREFHEVIGTYRQSGGDVAGYVLASTTAADRRPTTSEALLYDEDLPTTVPLHNTKANYSQLYLTGAAGDLDPSTGNSDIVELSGSQPYYNEWTGSIFQKTLMANNSYMNIFQLAIPVGSDTDSQLYRFVYMAGQTNGTLTAVRQESVIDLNLGELATFSPEFVFIQKITIQYTGGSWSWTETERLDGTRAQYTASPSGAWLTSVTSDDTLTGNGTVASPLGLAPDIALSSGDEYKFSDGETSGSDEMSVTWRTVTSFLTSDTLTGDSTDGSGFVLAPGPQFLYGLLHSGDLMRLEMGTLKLVETVNGVGASGARALRVFGDVLIYFFNNTVIEFNLTDLTDSSQKTATGIGAIFDAVYDTAQGAFLAVNTIEELVKITPGSPSYSVSTIATLTGILGDVRGIELSADGLSIYVAEAVYATGSLYIRKYNKTTGAIEYSSSAIPVSNGRMSRVQLHDGLLVVSYDSSIAIYEDTGSALNLLYTYANTVVSAGNRIIGGLLFTPSYNAVSFNVYAQQLPSLTEVSKGFRERHGEGINSSPSVVDSDGDLIYHTDADAARAIPAVVGHDKTLQDASYRALGLAPDIALEAGEKYAFTDGVLANLDSEFSHAWRETTALWSSTAAVANVYKLHSSNRYIFVTSTVSFVGYLIDRITGSLIKQTSSIDYYSQGLFITDNIFIRFGSAGLVYYDVELDEGIYTSPAIAFGTTPKASVLSADGQTVYAINDSGEVFTWVDATKTATSLGTISGIAERVGCVAVDAAEQYLYIWEGNETTSGNQYARKVSLPGLSIVASSVALPSDAWRVSPASCQLIDEKYFLVMACATTTTNSVARIYDITTMSLVHVDTTIQNLGIWRLHAGICYSLASTTLTASQPSGLAEISNGFRERVGEGVSSSPSVLRPDNSPIYFSDSDKLRSIIRSESQDARPAGFISLEVVDYSDAKITNAIPGQRYLISSTSTSYADYLFEMRHDGGKLWHPTAGMTVYDLNSGNLLRWFNDVWNIVDTPTIFETFSDMDGTAGLNGQIAFLKGYNTQNDGAEGSFIFDSSSAPGDINDITIVDGGAGGNWIRQHTPGVIDARWAGAVGDGVTDDYAALQSCLDSLDAGGTLQLSAGDYYIGTGLDAGTTPGIRITGVGCVRWQHTSDPITVISTDQAIDMITFGDTGAHSPTGPKLDNFSMRDTSGTGAVTRAISAINISYARFEDISFGSITGGTCIDIDGTTSTSINCEIRGCYGRNVLNGIKAQNSNSTKIFGGYFSGGSLGGKGLEVTGGGDSIMVFGMSVDSFDDGVHCNSSTGAVMLQGCRLEANGYGVRLSSGGSHIIQGPFIRNAAGQTGIRVEATAGTAIIIAPVFLDSVGTQISDSGLYTTYYGGNRTPDKKVFWSLENTATPTVINGNIFKTGSTRTISPITNLSGGKEGQIVTLFCDAAVTVQSNANIALYGANDFEMSVDDSLVLLKVGTTWKQVGGSVNQSGYEYFTTTEQTNLATLASGDVTALHAHNGVVEVEATVSATPGSPSTGEFYLFDADHATQPNKLAYYDGSTWSYTTLTESSRFFDKTTRYYMEWHDNALHARVEWVLKATTNDGAGTGDSAILSFDGSTDYPTMTEWASAGDRNMLILEIFVHAETESAIVGSGNHKYAAWKFDAILVADDDSAPWYSAINGVDSTSFPVSMSAGALFSPATAFAAPTIEIDTTTKEIKINVQHTSATSGDVRWWSELRGYDGSGRGYEVGA